MPNEQNKKSKKTRKTKKTQLEMDVEAMKAEEEKIRAETKAELTQNIKEGTDTRLKTTLEKAEERANARKVENRPGPEKETAPDQPSTSPPPTTTSSPESPDKRVPIPPANPEDVIERQEIPVADPDDAGVMLAEDVENTEDAETPSFSRPLVLEEFELHGTTIYPRKICDEIRDYCLKGGAIELVCKAIGSKAPEVLPPVTQWQVVGAPQVIYDMVSNTLGAPGYLESLFPTLLMLLGDHVASIRWAAQVAIFLTLSATACHLPFLQAQAASDVAVEEAKKSEIIL